MELLLPTLVLFHLLYFANGYPTGAPTSACEDMVPRHTGVQPQPSPPPYTVLTNTRTFQPGEPVTVTIVGPVYRGVLLEARTTYSSTALGSWQLPPPDTKLLECKGNPRGAITHSNINIKGNTTAYSWIPPTSASSLYFKATVAQQRTIFWLNVRSATLTRGDKLSGEGVEPDRSKVQAILYMPPPTDKKGVLRAMGVVHFLGKFIPNLCENGLYKRSAAQRQSVEVDCQI
ncbi:putative defense protein Hdd11 [Lampris incognitus]|uniref:putative defense protein Hdd11 n=1 Tax=Lampris incognitus TaxID=2546036 RepID=UPI0024B515BE|nr:putative defense protein Hdd11 [Lampris incognitus]